ncbi:hypothetical protein M422DRAFT_31112 [Sphaerobolus stellatus SS14]|uniref:Uncharacterized protein n=1 Tax=Sphaerobolus stellatus (strain SS14) TaxID=990650 RepID=A0A0C9VMF7_SPHS4|nr:hypothetical protein M422DRAFT_31112 [Sphaerobolus stellatus SS14]
MDKATDKSRKGFFSRFSRSKADESQKKLDGPNAKSNSNGTLNKSMSQTAPGSVPKNGQVQAVLSADHGFM